MWLLKLLSIVAIAYAAVVLITYAAQTRLLFPGSSPDTAFELSALAERMVCKTVDGETLHGMRISPARGITDDQTLIIGFGGNAWNADHMAGYLHELFPASEVVSFHYRGYGPSTGQPGAAALLGDASHVFDCAIEGREPAAVVAVGFSIGSGVAVHLARNRPLAGLILVTPFDSLENLARQHYGWLPVRHLLRHQMHPAEQLQQVTSPVAIIAAEQDSIIPEARTEPLRMAAQALVMDRTISGVGHNDIYGTREFAAAMREAKALMVD